MVVHLRVVSGAARRLGVAGHVAELQLIPLPFARLMVRKSTS